MGLQSLCGTPLTENIVRWRMTVPFLHLAESLHKTMENLLSHNIQCIS